MTEKHTYFCKYTYTHVLTRQLKHYQKIIKIKGNVLELHMVHNKGNTMTIALPRAYTKKLKIYSKF